MIAAADALLSAAQLRAVADQWRRERRVLETSFSGVSMLPAIRPGQMVTLDCGAIPRLGDVAVFVLDNQVGVHRIAARAGDVLLPWGDANALPDDPIVSAQVVGILQGIAPQRAALGRSLLLRLWLDPRRMNAEALRRRVRRLHHYREIGAGGPAAVVAHLRRALRRRRARA